MSEVRLIDANKLPTHYAGVMLADICGTIVYGTDIDAAPAIDAVPVVRCRDCEKRGTTNCGMRYNETDDDGRVVGDWSWEEDNDFCSWGKRKGAL
jgi:hypothetical protein